MHDNKKKNRGYCHFTTAGAITASDVQDVGHRVTSGAGRSLDSGLGKPTTDALQNFQDYLVRLWNWC